LLFGAAALLEAAGGVCFHDRPLSATKAADVLEARSLTNAALKSFIEKGVYRELTS